jgi:hypothetical protein
MSKSAKKAKSELSAGTILAIKGFNADLTCRGFQFVEGETYKHDGIVKACEGGFHAITGHPLSVLQYYAPAGSRFHIVELSGATDSDDDEKTAAEIIKIGKQIGLGDLANEAVKWVMDRANFADGPVATQPNEAATASGDQGAATASGTRGAATASGYQGAATASGYQGAATASGDQGAATASGYQGAATASGYQGAATASGTRGAATASGTRGAATASGFFGKVQGKEGSALFLVERLADYSENHGKILHVWAGIVGQDGIKADTWYTLRDGKPVEVEA